VADPFFSLSAADRLEALLNAGETLGRAPFYLEKDVWVVWALSTLYGSTIGGHVAFKGGTSLSKAFHIIERFSEDIDITYDVRQLIPELIGEHREGLPLTRSQADKWSRNVKKRLPIWIVEVVKPIFDRALITEGLPGNASVEEEKLVIHYEPVTPGVCHEKRWALLNI